MRCRMSTLSDIKAECERDKARMDSEHEKMDKLTDEQNQSQGWPTPSYPPLQAMRGPNPVKVFIIVLLVLAVVAIVTIAVVGIQNAKSPKGVFEAYVDAVNGRDIRGVFDHTVMKFNPNYEQMLPQLEASVFANGPHITILQSDVILRAEMSEWHLSQAQELISEIQDELNLTIDDYCYVSYHITIDYSGGYDSNSFPAEVLCVSVGGSWYLAVPGYF